MIRDILEPLICERFLTDARYREGHLRILNALPEREVLGLHSPEIKEVAKRLSVMGTAAGCEGGGLAGTASDVGSVPPAGGMKLIMEFEKADPASLCYEEIVVWGFMINLAKCPVERKFEMLDRFVPVMDNWGVCDSYVAHAKWMKKVPGDELLAYLDRWFGSHREFEVRFAVVVSMCYLLDSRLDDVFERLDALDFNSITSDYTYAKARLAEIRALSDACIRHSLKHPSEIQSGCVLGPEPYYVRMAVAWLLATALAKYPEETRGYARTCSLPPDVLKLYTRKVRESFRTRDLSPY